MAACARLTVPPHDPVPRLASAQMVERGENTVMPPQNNGPALAGSSVL